MHSQTRLTFCKSQEQFKLRFMERFRELLDRSHSAARAFGPAWEASVDEIPLPDLQQGEVYRELIDWARAQDLFTRTRRRLVAQHQAMLH